MEKVIKRAFIRAIVIWIVPAAYLASYSIFRYGLETPTWLAPASFDPSGLAPMLDAPFIWLLICLAAGVIAFAILETRRPK